MNQRNPIIGRPADTHRRPTVGFVLEQTLGHVTHSDNLRATVSADARIHARWREIDFAEPRTLTRLPLARNWTLRAGLQARRAIATMRQSGPLDALFIHTQVPAILAGRWLTTVPSVVSVDATPRQYDELGSFYQHRRGPAALEASKWRLNRQCFERAEHIVSWSQWAKDGLVRDYGVPPEKVTVIPPGVRTADWQTPVRSADGVVRLLFVGADLDRKGGTVLLEAFSTLRCRLDDPESVELHMVTKSAVAPTPGVIVHRDVNPNSERLRNLYARADVFCLPTRGDCLPMVLSEAGAAGLPLVSTDVGAIREVVRDGDTGFLIPPDDVAALTSALERLVTAPELRRHQGARAAALVASTYDAVTNARRLVELLAATATSPSRVASRGSTKRDGNARDKARPEPRTLLTVSGAIPHDLDEQVEHGLRPRADYAVMADTFGADLLDRDGARRAAGTAARMLARLAGPDVLVAWSVFRQRAQYDVVLTDGEQVGLPYALLCRFSRRSGPRHVMIVHIISVSKKAILHRALGLGRHIDRYLTYATSQRRFLERKLKVPASRVIRIPFMVDTRFFTPVPGAETNMICSAGLEYRDYPTLIEAVRDLKADVVLAAASPWSKRTDTTERVTIPDNVTVCRLGFSDLRDLYAACQFVVVPLENVPFQAGVTTILEAMAMGKAVICTRTTGQTDVIVDGITGLYVPPGDVEALRSAITRLLDHPEEARRMGAAGRRVVEEQMDVGRYAERIGHVVRDVAREPVSGSTTNS